MIDIKMELIASAKAMGVKINAKQAEKFQKYMEMLLEWNERLNLTAITEPQEIVVKHFLDSLTVLKAVELKESAKVIDVGTGAGFPGIPLKIMRPDMDLTLLDGANKRLIFLSKVCEELNLKSHMVHKRAEEAGLDKKMRENYDIAVARAVAPLNILCEYCIPLIKMKGTFIAMKGPGAVKELECSQEAVEFLGGLEPQMAQFILENGEERNLLLIQKTRFTSREYPRHGGTIIKHPLGTLAE